MFGLDLQPVDTLDLDPARFKIIELLQYLLKTTAALNYLLAVLASNTATEVNSSLG